MGILDSIMRIIRRVLRRKAEEVVEDAVEEAVDKVVDKATDKALKDAGVTVSNGTTSTETASLREVTEEAEAKGENVTININVNGDAANAYNQAMANSAAAFAQANEVMKYLILDKNNNIIGVTDDAPQYIKNAYENGEFDNKD